MPEKGPAQQGVPAPPPPGAGLGRGFPDLGLSLGAGGDQAAMLKWLQHQADAQGLRGAPGGGGVTPPAKEAADVAVNAYGAGRKLAADTALPGGVVGGGVGGAVVGPGAAGVGGPLAALHAAAAARGLFGVSRVNPLFLEDASPPSSPPPPPPTAVGKRRGAGGAAIDSGSGSDGCGGGKSGSSGYGGHSSSDGGCASSSGGEDECTPSKGGGAGLSVLRRDAAFVSSICIPPPNSPGALLSPIPEGVVGADAVPRPVWPRSTASSSSSSSSSTSSREGGGVGGGGGEASAAEEALRRLSLTLSGSRHVERVTRALGGCSSSSGAGTASSGACSSGSSLRASPSSGSAASSREGSLRGGVGCVGARPSPAGSSSSGFSELTPPGSARRAPAPGPPPPPPLESDPAAPGGTRDPHAAAAAAAALLLQLLPPASLPSLPPPQLPHAFVLTAPDAASPAALRNAAFVYGTLRRPKGYERMRTPLADAAPAGAGAGNTGIAAGGAGADAVALPLADQRAHAKRDGLYALGAPDFTLDVARAERLLRKIREAKQRRCACRLLTCALALAVFLAAVVAVSMLVTRGQRVFGPI